MQGIYTYIPETNYVRREYRVAAILLLLFMVLISLVSVLNLLYFYISTFRSMCAVPNMAVFCIIIIIIVVEKYKNKMVHIFKSSIGSVLAITLVNTLRILDLNICR